MEKQNQFSDDVLIERYRKDKSQQAMALLCKRYWNQVYHFIGWKYYIAPEESKDLTQDVFMLLSFKLDKHYAEKGHFRSWLFRVVNNYMIDYVRKNRCALLFNDCNLELLRDYTFDNVEEKSLMFERANEAINELLDLLPPEKRYLMDLKFKKQKSFQEIADLLGIKKSTCVKRIRVICGKMREEMVRRGFDELPEWR